MRETFRLYAANERRTFVLPLKEDVGDFSTWDAAQSEAIFQINNRGWAQVFVERAIKRNNQDVPQWVHHARVYRNTNGGITTVYRA